MRFLVNTASILPGVCNHRYHNFVQQQRRSWRNKRRGGDHLKHQVASGLL